LASNRNKTALQCQLSEEALPKTQGCITQQGGDAKVFTICCNIIPDGKLADELKGMAQAESKFNRDLGVLRRNFYQCIDQPHVIWAITEWTSEEAHNSAAHSIMKVRKDDRVASAYFQPRLYLEFFGEELLETACVRDPEMVPALVVIGHGIIVSEQFESWNRRIKTTREVLSSNTNLLRSRIFCDHYNPTHFWGLMEWVGREGYEKERMIGDITVEEFTFVGGLHSELATYNQYYCAPLSFTRDMPNG